MEFDRDNSQFAVRGLIGSRDKSHGQDMGIVPAYTVERNQTNANKKSNKKLAPSRPEGQVRASFVVVASRPEGQGLPPNGQRR